MRDKDVKGWVSGYSGSANEDPYDTDDDFSPSRSGRGAHEELPDPDENWDGFLAHAEKVVGASGTKARIGILQHRLKSVAKRSDLDQTRRVELLALLLPTYARYTDSASRVAALEVGAELLRADEEASGNSADEKRGMGAVMKHGVGWLRKEAERICKQGAHGGASSALSLRFALLSWLCTFFAVICKLAPPPAASTSPVWPVLVGTLSTVFDSIMVDAAPRQSVRKSTLVLTRRTVRNAHGYIPSLISTLVGATGSGGLRAVAFLGLVLDVAVRLRVGKETGKGMADGVGRGYVREAKEKILQFFTSQILSSKTPVPPHVTKALNDFVATEVTDEDVTKTVRPQMEKMLLRSPEVALPIVADFFSAFGTSPSAKGDAPGSSADLSAHVQPLLPSITSASRSTNAATRSKTCALFSVLIARVQSDTVRAISDELLNLLKSGKTSSPEQRAALFAMLASCPAGSSVSPVIADSLAAILPKETNEASLAAALNALAVHEAWCLNSDQALSPSVPKALVKGLQEAKAPLRKAACLAVGTLLWNINHTGASDTTTESLRTLGEALLPGLETNLKNAAANPLTNPAGPLEGYIAVALLEGRMTGWGSKSIGTFLSNNAVIQALLNASPKPSFLLSDKVYRKAATQDEEVWLLRALGSVASRRAKDLANNKAARISTALAFVHLAFAGSTPDTRRQAISSVTAANARAPRVTASLIREGLLAWLSQRANGPAPAAAVKNAEGEEVSSAPKSYGRQMRALLSAVSSFPDETPAEERQDVLLSLLVLAHHPEVDDRDRQCFIDLCHRGQVDPRLLATSRLPEALTAIEDAVAAPETREAAFPALSSLAFVAPDVVIAELVTKVEGDLAAEETARLTQEQLGMWQTPQGSLYVDVLSTTKDNKVVDKNRKDASIEQWEAELRESLAKKKAAASRTLTKDEKAAVDAQSKVEAAVRSRVQTLQDRLIRALRTIGALVDARTGELDGYLVNLNTLMEQLLRVPQANILAGKEIKWAFWKLADCCSPRLGIFGKFVGVAMLRTVDDDMVDEDFRHEPMHELVTRILYRLRSLSEQAPLDIATVAFATPLISTIIASAGLGLAADDNDGVMEQIQLALDYIVFHGPACGNPHMPRAQFIDDLVRIVSKHTQLAKEAVSALRDLGEAMRTSALPNEIQKLLQNTLADEVYVRNGCLSALQPLDLTDLDFPSELWLACHDEDDENTRLAEKAWDENGLDVPTSYSSVLVPFLEHGNAYVRLSCGRAITEAARLHPETVPVVIKDLTSLYRERSKELRPEHDKFGMLIESTLNREDPWRVRSAIALAFRHLAELFAPSDVEPFFDFLIAGQALGDRHEDVRQKMLDAGTAVIDIHGKERLAELLGIFENFFNHPTSAGDSNDGVTEACVILFGRLARHLEPTDKRVSQVVDRLVDALKTPSELVQAAVADCLPPLVGAISNDVPRLVEKLVHDLLLGGRYAERRGAAYGLAGLIMGRGIASIKEFRIMARLADAVEDKKNAQTRQGAMFAYETLTATLRRLFEPYIIDILPQLLACYSDTSADVREATQDTAKVIMQSISGHCVKLILPTLLAGLEEKQWRTKKGAIELLGAMAYCAPRQLSMSLPTVIPRLSDVLTDSHTQVRTSANRSLKQFGEVISNPEIKELVPSLLQALIDPNNKTATALTSLLETSFVHYIDSPSLALLVPIIDRGLRERSGEAKRKAAQIVGNLAGLTDSRDFVPYLDKLVPLVRVVLVDPVPEARATAARALGTLVERLGEVNFVNLVPDLLAVLRSDSTGVDRIGAAQGLAEVLAGLGMERMEGLLPDIINSASSSRSYVKAGYLSLLIYLPATFGTRFAPHLGAIIAPVLSGIADEVESVRDASMRAGRMIIANYSNKAIDLLLPELEQGLFDESWRIRMSSIQLVADLLFRLSGISGKNEVEDEDGEEEMTQANNSVQKALVEALGAERRDRILAAMYIVRQDPNIPVRQAAIHTWKALVHNTPRTAREILPTMLDIIIRTLASPGAEQTEMAARTVGELVRKLGEKILAQALPLLRVKGVESPDIKTRQGVCFALSEIMASATKTQLEDHEDAIIASVRHALVDESPAVRHAAAQAFDATQQFIGPRAIDETIPTLLEALRHPGGSSETALAALREVMRARADVVFPVLVPTLIAQPITAFNARALAALVRVAGTALNKRLSSILTALSKALETEKDEEVRTDLQEAVSANLGAVTDVEGLHQLMLLLLGWCGHESLNRRIAGCNFFATFCTVKKPSVDLSEYVVDWIRRLVSLFDDRVPEVVEAAWGALDAVIKTVSKEEMEGLVVPMRRTVESTGMAGREVAGFCRPKGVGPIVPVFLAGLMNGTAEQREQGALGLADLVERTSADAIKPFVTIMVGPLIRMCGDRHAPPVKAAILVALNTMLLRIPQHVRPFYPQLQRSYQKAVADPTSPTVRNKAAVALGTLMGLQTRVDPVILELVAGARAGTGAGAANAAAAGAAGTFGAAAADPSDLADSFAMALANVLEKAPTKNIGAPSREAVASLIDDAFEDSSKESFKKAVAEVCGAMAVHDVETVRAAVEKRVVVSPTDAQLASLCVRAMLERAPKALYDLGVAEKVARLVGGWVGEPPSVARPARESKEMIKTKEPWCEDSKVLDIL